ncbi:hypothetical protein WICMUC_002356 [Wickerhamomyces mucosus]|uniref:CID domain-containing protein n=1 Tax=Wickerhamomyces mucosus TaxID=1378264 RepID=A0A9P8PRA5_9ASCO|nr:hypothetical protein WICMUC_002356 [Wickerhamomyces mucosus]
MSYSEDVLRSKFDALEESQESIVSTSQWVLFHHRHGERTANEWKNYISQSLQKKKLPLIYLANEVIQQARNKRRMEFVDAFSKVLPSSIKEAYDNVPEKIKQKITKIVNIWRERRIFSTDLTILDIEIIGSGPSTKAPIPQQVPEAQNTHQPTLQKIKEEKDTISVLKISSEKFQKFYESLLFDATGTFSQDHLPQLLEFSHVLEENISKLQDISNRVSNEIKDVKQLNNIIEAPKPVNITSISEQQKQQHEQSINHSVQPEPQRNFSNISALGQLEQLKKLQELEVQRKVEEDLLPSYEDVDSDSDEEKLATTSTRESTPSIEEENLTDNNAASSKPPKKKLRFAL